MVKGNNSTSTTKKTFDSSWYVVIIVGIISVVAIFAILQPFSLTTPRTTTTQQENVGGMVYNRGDTNVPAGFAPPFDPVLASAPNYITLNPTTSGANTNIQVTTTKDTPTMYVYKTGYYSINGAPWQQYNLLGTMDSTNNWIINGAATATITTTTPTTTTNIYVLTYVCKQYTGSTTWYCGPTNNPPNAADRKWTIQNTNIGNNTPTTPTCINNTKQCSGNINQTCINNQWSGSAACPSQTICSPISGTCVASCTPQCTGKICGSDGCGGSCGTCQSGTCNTAGTACDGCTPTPQATACAGKNCGSVPNGCGLQYSCGMCSNPAAPLCINGQCVASCTPLSKAQACSGRICGTVSDGCTGTIACGDNAGACADSSKTCNSQGQCVTCTPALSTFCSGKACGVFANGTCAGIVSCGGNNCGVGKTCDGTGTCRPSYPNPNPQIFCTNEIAPDGVHKPQECLTSAEAASQNPYSIQMPGRDPSSCPSGTSCWACQGDYTWYNLAKKRCECTSSLTCPSARPICSNGQCVDVGNDCTTAQEGQRRCSSSNGAIQTCSGGQWVTTTSCSSGQSCNPTLLSCVGGNSCSAMSGFCAPAASLPANSMQVSNPNLQGCAATELCVQCKIGYEYNNGQCAKSECLNNNGFCFDAQYQPDGFGETAGATSTKLSQYSCGPAFMGTTLGCFQCKNGFSPLSGYWTYCFSDNKFCENATNPTQFCAPKTTTYYFAGNENRDPDQDYPGSIRVSMASYTNMCSDNEQCFACRSGATANRNSATQPCGAGLPACTGNNYACLVGLSSSDITTKGLTRDLTKTCTSSYPCYNCTNAGDVWNPVTGKCETPNCAAPNFCRSAVSTQGISEAVGKTCPGTDKCYSCDADYLYNATDKTCVKKCETSAAPDVQSCVDANALTGKNLSAVTGATAGACPTGKACVACNSDKVWLDTTTKNACVACRPGANGDISKCSTPNSSTCKAASCTAQYTCDSTTAPAPDGQVCGTDKWCSGGTCTTACASTPGQDCFSGTSNTDPGAGYCPAGQYCRKCQSPNVLVYSAVYGGIPECMNTCTICGSSNTICAATNPDPTQYKQVKTTSIRDPSNGCYLSYCSSKTDYCFCKKGSSAQCDANP